jgi:hypothetical protein
MADDCPKVRVAPMIEHGTHSAYVHLACRCDDCRAAEKEYQRRYRESNRARLNAYDREPWRDSRLRDDRTKRLIRHRSYDRFSRGKQLECERCGAPNAQLHHPDYAQPDAVDALCAPCHGLEHRF